MTHPNKWLIFADEDWLIAKSAMQQKIFNQVCFHAQQGSEKLLKGYLSTRGRSNIPRTHSTTELLHCCLPYDATLLELKNYCHTLDRYYIPTRYPDALPGTLADGMPNESDAIQALQILDIFRTRLIE